MGFLGCPGCGKSEEGGTSSFCPGCENCEEDGKEERKEGERGIVEGTNNF